MAGFYNTIFLLWIYDNVFLATFPFAESDVEYGPSQEPRPRVLLSFTFYAWMGELALNRPYQTQLPEGMDVGIEEEKISKSCGRI